MDEKKFLRVIGVAGLALMIAFLSGGGDLAFGNNGPKGLTWYANSPDGRLDLEGNSSGPAIAKFVDSLPGLGPTNPNNLGQYIPIAQPMTNALFPDDDYYEIGIKQYTKKVHTNLPNTTRFRGYIDLNPSADPLQQYLGPLIVAQRDRPVRVKFTNLLGTGAAGNLFLPVDITLNGAGLGPLLGSEYYTQNRTSIHNHGAFTPWVSDGTPHQWFTPAGEGGSYLKGVSFQNVPDMPDPGVGSQTLYYTNQQSGRLMFYHDHAVGITRLNVYAGMAAGYLLYDKVETDLIDGTNITGVNTGVIEADRKAIPGFNGGVYKYGIPLIIQDKTFVPQNIAFQDDKWAVAGGGPYGDLWFPHIYEPNESQTDPSGLNPYGRWSYGPWVQPNILLPVELMEPELKAALPLPNTPADSPWLYPTSFVPESFMDTMMVNGTLYPFLNVERKAYRFRILNACNDRFLNLQLYLDASGGGTGATADAIVNLGTGGISSIGVTNGGTGYIRPPGINITGGGGFGASAVATLSGTTVSNITITNPGRGYTSNPTITIGAKTEVTMVPAIPNGWYPPTWPFDGRDGGVPDPATAGPKFIQIGNEGGLLPGVTVRDNQPVYYDDMNPATLKNVLNMEGVDPAIKGVTVFLGPAERADVIVDFSGVPANTNVILYNDAPAPVPGFQPRYDYYTGCPDQTDAGGAPQTLVGFGPNTRTIMQFRVTGTTVTPFNLAALEAAIPKAYVLSQPPPIVPQTYYPGAYHSSVDYHARINATSLTFTPLGSTVPVTLQAEQKAIVELFDPYGRINATLGYEFFVPDANPARSNGVGFAYIDPPAEVFYRGQIQLWKITHNGVDTHPIHIHLNNAQIVNRVGWDNVIKPPEPWERGWKETIRMNPLESVFIAQKADLPTVPFVVPDSVRPLNPARPLGNTEGFTNINPKTGQPLNTTPTVNTLYNFGAEYVWHCHILGHEENDMMRPLKVTGLIPVGSLDMLLLVD
jgi:FtsP/CotA-like multicopper oxidase with cupredoxin domain